MGLAVGVGVLADLNANDEDGAGWLRERLGKVNRVLADNNLPTHTEPKELPALRSRAPIGSFPYSFLHYLRRFAAHVWAKPGWKPEPFPEDEDPARDPLVTDEMAMLSSHLLCHSDAEGYYVPIDFEDPIFAETDMVPGGMLGSSYGLMRELVAVVPALGVKLATAN